MSSETIEPQVGSFLFSDRDARAHFLAGRVAQAGREMARLNQSTLEMRRRADAELAIGNHFGSDQLLELCNRLLQRQALMQQRINLLEASLEQMRWRSML